MDVRLIRCFARALLALSRCVERVRASLPTIRVRWLTLLGRLLFRGAGRVRRGSCRSDCALPSTPCITAGVALSSFGNERSSCCLSIVALSAGWRSVDRACPPQITAVVKPTARMNRKPRMPPPPESIGTHLGSCEPVRVGMTISARSPPTFGRSWVRLGEKTTQVWIGLSRPTGGAIWAESYCEGSFPDGTSAPTYRREYALYRATASSEASKNHDGWRRKTAQRGGARYLRRLRVCREPRLFRIPARRIRSRTLVL